MDNFKNNPDSRWLPDIDLFSIHNLINDTKASTHNYVKDKIIMSVDGGSFCLAFSFGETRWDSIFYWAYGANDGIANKPWNAWFLIDK
ncbi:hypothetical protein [Spiroplasma endosymbiont of Stenodema calcarata]|uniref:hypothetical protein n=1 Tax=Spiroplasma endosymbiont of Stenodema calcarata TaxID=3139328 RepID=UPI003CCB3490